MRSFLAQPIPILLLLFIAIAPVLTVGSSSVINATCAELKSLQPYDYCVGVLSADPAAAAAAATDVRGVAEAAVNITVQKAASTLSVIKYLVDDLNACREFYSDMIQSLEDSLVQFRDGRFLNASLAIANATMEPMLGCDILLFEGSAQKDPISKENNENNRLVYLADGIVDLFANKRQG